MAGLAAINEIDIKKIIALSTLSQLGVIIITLGLGSPHLSFFHLLSHAYFKSKDQKEEAKDAAPPSAEDLEKMKKDKLKKVIKEGGKRGVEIEGAADMGGLQFFCTSVDLPEGDLEMLTESMKAMNAKSDPTEEERNGGSGHIGKMIFSAGVDQLAVVAYVPTDKQKDLSCEEWLKIVLASQSGELKSGGKDMSTGIVK